VKALFGEWNKLREEVCLIEATGYFEMWETDIKKL
jgi:hypothetical protein